MNRRQSSGFTIVEILTVLVILGILAAIAFVSYSSQEARARDDARATQATIIAEALERYYRNNNEYPSCSTITASGSDVSKDLDVEQKTLIDPNSPDSVSNSISCGDDTIDSNGRHVFRFVGDGEAECSGDGFCKEWTLYYQDETTSSIHEIKSRNALVAVDQTTPADSAPDAPSLSVVSTGTTTAAVSWTEPAGAVEYRLQRVNNVGSEVGQIVDTTQNQHTFTGLSPGSTYHARVMAKNSSNQYSDWSNVVDLSTTFAAPGAPSMSASMSSTNAVGSASAVSCASGSPQYQIRYRSTNSSSDGSWSSWSNWSPSRTRSVGASQGYRYTFQSRARCVSGSTSSANSALSSLASTVRPINTPSTPSISVSTSGSNSSWTWNGSCPSGTSRRYQYEYTSDNGTGISWFTTSASGRSLNTAPQGYRHTIKVRVQCYTTHDTSSWSGSRSASYTRPVSPPPTPTFTGNITSSAVRIYSHTSCSGGTTLMSKADIYTESWSFRGSNFPPYPTQNYGWYNSYFGGKWWINQYTNLGTSVMSAINSNDPIPSGKRFRAAYIHRCQNLTTGRASSYAGIKYSPFFSR